MIAASAMHPRPSRLRALSWLLLCLHLQTFADPLSFEERARTAFARGAFSEAASAWEQSLAAPDSQRPSEARVLTSVSLAGAYQALGQQRRAVQLLESTLNAAQQVPGQAQLPLVQARLGGALLLTLDLDRAEALLNQALASARTGAPSKLAASILNDRGNLLALRHQTPEALAAFDEAASLAPKDDTSGLAAQALANAAATATRAQDAAAGERYNARALAEIDRMSDSHAKGFLLLTAGLTDRQLALRESDPARARLVRAHRSFSRCLELAESLPAPSLRTYALGYLGDLYERDGNADAALGLSQRAAFAAQQARMPEALYRWEWQTGRLLRKRGDAEPAIAAYRRAVQSLQPIRHDLSLGYGNAASHLPFRESEGPMFFELADLLLRQARTTQDPERNRTLLREARETVEQLKAVELEDYFRDDCVNIQRGKARSLDNVDPSTAVVYFVPLPDRTEILVGLGADLRQFTAEVTAENLASQVRALRRGLENRTSHGYLVPARQLHDWLIQPIRPLLEERHINTLVFVPDGALRTIPFASLHDGQRFVIEDYAVAAAPGLSLVEPQPIERERSRLLLNGLTNSVQGFPPLYFVADELSAISPMYRGTTLANEAFTLGELRRRMSDEQYSIVHIASHGKFDKDVRGSYVLTYDSKLTLNDLESLIRPGQYRGRPVELLVLSACQTAAGDDRAALGLAGVAVKAGARSALATLWFVNDQSTSALVSELYGQLRQDPSLSKARALQAAQLQMLADRRFRHPCYWSPYLIVGNWL
jgi:CHAT domain-containing protein